MYKNLSISLGLYIVGEIIREKFTIHERHLQALNGKIVDFNTESQNNRI